MADEIKAIDVYLRIHEIYLKKYDVTLERPMGR